MNRLFLIVGVGIAIAALMFLSQGIKKAAPTDEDLQQQAQQAQIDAQKEAQKAAAKPAAPPQAAEVRPAEETVGNPAAAKHHILVGWVYDEKNQASPAILDGPIQIIRQYVKNSGGTASAEIVNLDIPAKDRSPAAQGVTMAGVTMDGKVVFPDNLSDMHITAPQITAALTAAAK